MNKWPVIIAVSAVASIVFVSIASSTLRKDVGPDVGDGLDFKQDSSATDRGIRLSAVAASFSGTSTLLQVEVDVSGAEGISSDVVMDAVEARIPASAIRAAPTFAATESGRLRLQGSGRGTGVLRLSPLASTSQKALITIMALDLLKPSGESIRVTGRWTLDLQVPSDVARLLKTEDLEPGAPASDQGITVRVLGATRSSSETLVTFGVESPEAVVQLGQPVVSDGSTTFYGQQISAREDGNVVTYTFPPTAPGKALTLSVGPFARKGNGETQRMTFELGEVMRRSGLSAKFGERAPVEPVDIVEGRPNSITEVDFARTGPGKVDIIGVTAAGNWDNVPDTRLILRDGIELPISGAESWYLRDASGAISGGFTRFEFQFSDASKLDGVATLAVVPPDVVVRGAWQVKLVPKP